MYWTSHALIWTNLIYYILSVFLGLFDCTPINEIWYPLITNGHCMLQLVLNVAAGLINALSDITILILPQINIGKLQITLRNKIQISAIFLIDLFSVRLS